MLTGKYMSCLSVGENIRTLTKSSTPIPPQKWNGPPLKKYLPCLSVEENIRTLTKSSTPLPPQKWNGPPLKKYLPCLSVEEKNSYIYQIFHPPPPPTPQKWNGPPLKKYLPCLSMEEKISYTDQTFHPPPPQKWNGPPLKKYLLYLSMEEKMSYTDNTFHSPPKRVKWYDLSDSETFFWCSFNLCKTDDFFYLITFLCIHFIIYYLDAFHHTAEKARKSAENTKIYVMIFSLKSFLPVFLVSYCQYQTVHFKHT